MEWLREDHSEARRFDAKADIDHDQDLSDYNAMLEQLNKTGDQSVFRQR